MSGHETMVRFLRLCWTDVIERWRHASTLEVYPAAQRLVAAGADPEVVRRLCGAVALDTLAVIEHSLDYGFDPDDPDAPGWLLVEADPVSGSTGAKLVFLHEEGLLADPRGIEGRDLWREDDDAPGIDFSRERWRSEVEPL